MYAVKNGIEYKISREEYDVFLLLSTILTQHRYDIIINMTIDTIKEISIDEEGGYKYVLLTIEDTAGNSKVVPLPGTRRAPRVQPLPPGASSPPS